MHTLARMLWLHRRIRATTVYAACTARVELAAFDYAYTHTRLRRYYARGRRVALGLLASRIEWLLWN